MSFTGDSYDVSFSPPGKYQRWASTQDVQIHGLASVPFAGEEREIWNVGSYNITFVNQSTHPYRQDEFFTATGSDLVLPPGQAALARYDPLSNPDENDNFFGSWCVSLIGPPRLSTRRVTTNTTLAPQDRFVEIDASANNVAVIVPAGNSVSGGTEVTLKRIDNNSSHTVTYIVDGPGTIDGSSSSLPLVAQGSFVRLAADGSSNAWYVTGSDRWAAGDFSVGVGLPNLPGGLTVNRTLSETALGYSNCRMGLAPSGQPEVIWEHAGYAPWAWDNYQGALRLTTPAQMVQARFTTDGSLALGNSAPHASATLDLQSTSKGLRLPYVSNPSSINSPAAGLLVFNTSTSKLNFYDGSAWRIVTSA
jgi:hypothetical protein